MSQIPWIVKVSSLECSFHFLLLILVLLHARVSLGYHGANNLKFDCWPLNATKTQNQVVDCDGLEMGWTEPPMTVEKGQKFNVSYWVTADEQFFESSINAYPGKNGTYIRQLCQNTTCPESNPNKENCCVWHANIHTCHPGVAGTEICGPWVGNDGRLSTHTDSKWGSLNQKFVAQDVQINFVGENFIIAHLKVGDIHVAIGQHITVTSQKICGDDQCSAEIGETCMTCARDCCPRSLPVQYTIGITFGILIFIGIFVSGTLFIAVTAWYCLQRRKLFYDETWIINTEDVHPDTGVRGMMGSLVSIKNMRGEAGSMGMGESTTITSMQRQQLFTQTGI